MKVKEAEVKESSGQFVQSRWYIATTHAVIIKKGWGKRRLSQHGGASAVYFLVGPD